MTAPGIERIPLKRNRSTYCLWPLKRRAGLSHVFTYVKNALAVLLLLLLASNPTQAFELDGAFTQGGLVVGRTEPGSTVAVDGRPVRVSAGGRFILGFGRDAADRAVIEVSHPGGGTESRTIEVAKRQYPVQRIDGLPSAQVTPDTEALKRIKADNARIGEARTLDTDEPYFASGFAWPLVGRISGVFGSQRILNGEARRPHNGVDVAAPAGTLVRAPADGVVAMADEDMFFTGKTLMIDHGHGLTSVYAHMSAILVAEGRPVARGEPIGRTGMSGRATGPHLHWGVTLFATHLDPALLAAPMPPGTRD